MVEKPPVSCICLTYGRPHVLVEEAIHSFLQQDYEGKKELLILNDYADQVLVFNHPEVTIINIHRRFKTLGEKHNAAVSLCSHDIIFVWDDDDIFFPNRLSLSIKYLSDQRPYYNPRRAFLLSSGELSGPSGNMFHSCGCWYRSLFDRVNGYSHINIGQDADIDWKFEHTIPGITGASEISVKEIFYVYRWGTGSYHGSGYGKDVPGEKTSYDKVRESVEYQRQIGSIKTGIIELRPHWEKDYIKMVSDFLNKVN